MKRWFHRCETEEGYSLMEVMITLVVFSGSILMIGSIFPLATRSLSKGKEMMRANYLAQEKLEELINEAHLTPDSSGDEDIDIFSREWTIDDSDTDPTILDDLLRVRINISWTDPYQQDQSILLTTFVSKER